MNEPRVYRMPLLQTIVLFLMAAFFGYVAFSYTAYTNWTLSILLAGFSLLFLAIAVYQVSLSVSVSDTEVASTRLWITHSLAWSEVQQVTGGIGGLNLKNADGDVTVRLNAQMPGYEEMVSTVGQKRPALFSSPEFSVLERSIFSTLGQLVFFFVMLGIGAYIYLQASTPWFMAAFFVIIAIAVAAMFIGSPQSIALEGNRLLVKYLFKENTYSADDVESVQLNYQRTRNGRIYFAQVQFKDKKTLRISSMSVGASVTYLVLREWHERQKSARLSV